MWASTRYRNLEYFSLLSDLQIHMFSANWKERPNNWYVNSRQKRLQYFQYLKTDSKIHTNIYTADEMNRVGDELFIYWLRSDKIIA